MDQFYEKVFSQHATAETRTKKAMMDILDGMPKHSSEMSFCKALKTILKSKTMGEAVDSLTK